VVETHTGTREWQSFELRMRRRRIARCLLRADIAAQAGDVEGTSEALAEIRQLDPNAPEIAELERRLAKPPVQEIPRAPRRLRKTAAIAAAVVAALIMSVGWRVFNYPTETERPVPQPVRLEVETAGVMVPVPTVPPAGDNPIPAAAPPAAAERELHAPPLESPDTRNPGPETVPLPSDAPVDAPRAIPALPLPIVATAPAPEAVKPPASRVEPEPVPDLIGRETPRESPPPAPRDQTPGVRTVLEQYQSGYNALDAGAVRTVWPAVDERALARAFDGLASQHVWLGPCEVSVEAATAQASCTGTASWKARIGGTTHTEQRRWAFELTNTAGTWRIVQARTARR